MNRPARPARIAVAQHADAHARFTATEYAGLVARAADLDIRLELLGGELLRMNPPMKDHARRQLDVGSELRAACRGDDELVVYVEVGIELADDSVLVCDVAVARAGDGQRGFLKPGEIVLAVEISDTTLAKDLGAKRQAYAAGSVPDYWVVDTARTVVHCHADPVAGDYRMVRTYCFGEPVPVPGVDGTITLD